MSGHKYVVLSVFHTISTEYHIFIFTIFDSRGPDLHTTSSWPRPLCFCPKEEHRKKLYNNILVQWCDISIQQSSVFFPTLPAHSFTSYLCLFPPLLLGTPVVVWHWPFIYSFNNKELSCLYPRHNKNIYATIPKVSPLFPTPSVHTLRVGLGLSLSRHRL